ncbi:MFS transporter, partial [Devosia sp.]|uniref:MFS transporter n=1 Tax=Devosia sp. TaxID=1871048 RepID=UPI0037BEA48E
GAFGLGFALSQAVFIAPSIKKFGEPATVLIGMVFAAIAFTGTAFIHSEVPLYLFLLVGSLAGLAGPAINSLMSHQVSDNAQGELQGAINATNSLAAILGPLMATQLFNHFSKGQAGSANYFPGAPFIGSGIMVLIAAGVFAYAVWRFDLMHRPRVSKKEHQHEIGQPGQQQLAPHDEGK